MNLILIFLFNLSLFKFTKSDDNTTSIINIMEPIEYYLIISGILLGTLIFLFIAFILLYIRNKKPNIIYNLDNTEHTDEDIVEINNDIETNSYCEEIYDSKINTKHNSMLLKLEKEDRKSEEFNGFNDEYLELNSPQKLKKRNSSSLLKRAKSLENIKVNDANINKKDNNKNNINQKENREEYNYLNDKNNLLNELKKNLPDFIPKNMI